ncbi:MAG: galactose oxidase, partial [Thermoleophilaceae bacterium]
MRTRRRSVRRIQAAVGLVVFTAAAAVNGPPVVHFARIEHHRWLINTASYKGLKGHWSILPVPANMRVNGVHAAVLYTGEVLIVAGSGNSIGDFNAGRFESLLWDPKTDKFKKIRTPSDMFCGGHAFLPDGKLLIAGGTARYEQLSSQVHFAAGVMTVTNRDPRHGAILPSGTAFAAADGRVYRTTAPTVVPRATQQVLRVGRRLERSVTPSSTATWVSSTTRGAAGVTRVRGSYAVNGVGAGEAGSIQGSANSLTLDQQDFWGSRASYIFDPAGERYEKVSNMTLARWYPTLVGLPDGRVLSVSGLDQFGRIVPGNNEIFDPKTGRWTAAQKLFRPFPTYPALFLMPNGNLFFTGSNAGYGPSTPDWRSSGIWNLKRNSFQRVPGMRDPSET